MGLDLKAIIIHKHVLYIYIASIIFNADMFEPCDMLFYWMIRFEIVPPILTRNVLLRRKFSINVNMCPLLRIF